MDYCKDYTEPELQNYYKTIVENKTYIGASKDMSPAELIKLQDTLKGHTFKDADGDEAKGFHNKYNEFRTIILCQMCLD